MFESRAQILKGQELRIASASAMSLFAHKLVTAHRILVAYTCPPGCVCPSVPSGLLVPQPCTTRNLTFLTGRLNTVVPTNSTFFCNRLPKIRSRLSNLTYSVTASTYRQWIPRNLIPLSRLLRRRQQSMEEYVIICAFVVLLFAIHKRCAQIKGNVDSQLTFISYSKLISISPHLTIRTDGLAPVSSSSYLACAYLSPKAGTL